MFHCRVYVDGGGWAERGGVQRVGSHGCFVPFILLYLIAIKCRSVRKKNIRAVEMQQDDSGSGSDYGHVDMVATKERINSIRPEVIKAEMMVKGKPIVFQLDSGGASVNILNEKHVMEKNT